MAHNVSISTYILILWICISVFVSVTLICSKAYFVMYSITPISGCSHASCQFYEYQLEAGLISLFFQSHTRISRVLSCTGLSCSYCYGFYQRSNESFIYRESRSHSEYQAKNCIITEIKKYGWSECLKVIQLEVWEAVSEGKRLGEVLLQIIFRCGVLSKQTL